MATVRYVFDDMELNAVCYVSRRRLQATAPKVRHGRRYRDADGLWVSWHDYERPPTRVKCWENFPAHRTIAAMGAFLEECHAAGIVAPSSYSSLAHELFPYPRVPRSWSNPFAGLFVGGWEETFIRGRTPGPVVNYDLRSAYACAMAAPLPDPSTYNWVRRLHRGPGLYVVSGIPLAPRVPPPLKPGQPSTAALLVEEIDLYRMAEVKIHYGLTWRWSSRWKDEIFKLGEKVPSARKQILAAAWAQTAGRWIETECVPGRKRWRLRGRYFNLPWAYCVVHRVHQKVFELVDAAYHVFVDSAIVPAGHRVPLGDRPGAWRRVAEHPQGLIFEGAGIYREPGRGWVKRAGVPGQRPPMERGSLELALPEG